MDERLIVDDCRFDRCYDAHENQEVIFENEIKPNLRGLFKGINMTVFCYGMTGAGKTHTMQGTIEDPGIIYRTVAQLMDMISLEKEATTSKGSWKVYVSYYELYNEKVYDLTSCNPVDLPIREDQHRKIIIQNLSETEIENYQSFHDFYASTSRNRATASTKLNSHSSRSHAVVRLRILAQDRDEQSATYGQQFESKLHLIDLAGSEDNRRTENVGLRIVESSNINSSLFVLAKVVQALNDGDKRIPYRDSKLTRLLQDSLGGTAVGIMIANIAPGHTHFGNTFNTLNFASKSKKVVNVPTTNIYKEKEAQLSMQDKLEMWKKKKQIRQSHGTVESCDDIMKILNKPLKSKQNMSRQTMHWEKPFTSSERTRIFTQRIQQAQILETQGAQEAFDMFLSIMDDMRPFENVYKDVIEKIEARCTKLMCAIMDEEDMKYKGLLMKEEDTDLSSPDMFKSISQSDLHSSLFSSDDESDEEERVDASSSIQIPSSVTRRSKGRGSRSIGYESHEKTQVEKGDTPIQDENKPNEMPIGKLFSSPSLEMKVKQVIQTELELLEFSVDDQVHNVLHILNFGTEEEIRLLHGIGKIKAEQIIEYRQQERQKEPNFRFEGIENLARFGLRERAILTFMERNIIETVYYKTGVV